LYEAERREVEICQREFVRDVQIAGRYAALLDFAISKSP
jgi:hypothetical protein